MAEKVLIRQARIVDAYRDEIGDVLIGDGVIESVSISSDESDPSCENSGRANVIDGRGLLLTPGFIDMHAHSAITLFENPLLEAKIASGYTTDLICPDGLGPAPVRPESRDARRQYLAALETGEAPWNWESFREYLTAIEGARPAPNVAACVPHSAIRDYVMGGAARHADATELKAMCKLAATSIEEGAVAISFGLIYAPGLYANTDEIMALGDVAARYGVPLIPHVRNEADRVLESINEFVSVSERTGARVHLSHLKIIGNADLVEQLQELVVSAAERVALTFDQYPYGAGSTLLSALLPPYFLEGGAQKMMGRLGDTHERRLMARDMNSGVSGWENIYGNVGPSNIDVTQTAAGYEDLTGRNIEEIADSLGKSPEDTIFDLLLNCELNVGMIDHYSTEAVVRSIFETPGGMVGTDGVFNPHPHPRLHGTSARVLGRYAIREGLVSVQEAVARLATRPAECLGLNDRGRIESGYRADLVLIDSTEFIDRADFGNPSEPPEGIKSVFVNGELAFAKSLHTGVRSGHVLTGADK